jgi:hypothetical protein
MTGKIDTERDEPSLLSGLGARVGGRGKEDKR